MRRRTEHGPAASKCSGEFPAGRGRARDPKDIRDQRNSRDEKELSGAESGWHVGRQLGGARQRQSSASLPFMPCPSLGHWALSVGHWTFGVCFPSFAGELYSPAEKSVAAGAIKAPAPFSPSRVQATTATHLALVVGSGTGLPSARRAAIYNSIASLMSCSVSSSVSPAATQPGRSGT